MDIKGINANLSSPAISSLFETQTQMSKLLKPPSVITAMLGSPAIQMIQKQQDMLRKLTAPSSALTAFMDQQEKFHLELPSSLISSISAQQLSFSKAIASSIQVPDMNVMSGTLSKFAELLPPQPPMYNLAAEMGKALEACVPSQNMLNSVSKALEACKPNFELIGSVTSKFLESIPKIDSAVLSIVQQATSSFGNISESLCAGLSAFNSAFEQIDFSKFHNTANTFKYIKDFELKNDMLKKFGWFYISELPQDLVNLIYERRDEINQEEVDSLMVEYFRNNKCAALKKLVNSWVNLPYYESRNHIFHEAQVCHSQRLFNASTTLVSLHFEGVVTDFVRYRINQPAYRVDKALKQINELTYNLSLSTISFRNWIVCSFVLECVDQIFSTNFSPSDPDSCPDNSRHKIAHGHAIAKETEANSLRRFLFMNEMYKLFVCLEKEYQFVE